MSIFGERYLPVGPVEAPDGELVDAIDSFHARPVALRARITATENDRTDIAGNVRTLLSLPPHPNLSTVRDAFAAGGKYVIVMDRPEGQMLAAVLATRGDPGLTVSATLGYLEELAAALDYLHCQQPPVVHGDVRPESILVTSANAVLLMPAAGYRADLATDIAGFGATAIQLLTGTRPDSAAAALPDSSIWAGVDPSAVKQLSRILRRALETDPARRPLSAGVIADRLRAWRAADLPTGAVTFLLTDIEGSTNLWEAHPRAMASVISRHHEIVADCIDACNGRQPRSQGEGDSTLSVFARATDAISAVLAMQHALSAEPWAEDIVLKVRAGLHTGEAEVRAGDYFGAAVSRTARVRALARGGEVLLTQTTAQLAGDQLPAGIELRHAGRRALRGLAREEEIFQLQAEGLVVAPLPAAEDVKWVGPLPLPMALTSRSPIVGRAAELRQLLSAWTGAQAGEGSLALVAGEPGIGKTRLATEVAERVHALGGNVLYGRCYEENLISYQPFREAIRQYVDATPIDRLRDDLAHDGSMLTRLIPELLSRVPDLPPAVKAEPDTERYLLFEAVVSTLLALAARAPVLLVLDDLHWADQSTALLLARVARACPGARVMMLGTYRSEEVSDGDPLAAVIASLRRERDFRLLPLSGLPIGDVGALIQARTAGRASAELVSIIASDTNGNPYFISELVRHLAETGALTSTPAGDVGGRIPRVGLPDSVRELIERRLRRLSEQTFRVLTLAAIIGREFSLDVLQAISDTDDDVLDNVEEAMRSGAVVEGAVTGRHAFAHALIHSVLYGSLTGARRARLHLRIADTLAVQCGSDPDAAAEIAYHFLQATPLDASGRAVDWSRRAGVRALEQLAHEDALRWFERALSALGPADQPALRCDLLLDLAEACRRDGNGPALLTALQAAASEARSLGDADRLALAAIGSFSQGPTVEPNDVIVGLLTEALEALPRHDSVLRARVLAALAVELYFHADRERVIGLSGEAVAIARRLGDAATLARVLFERQIAIHDLAHVEERLAVGSEILQLAEQIGDAELTAMAHNVRFQCLIELGEIPQADRELAALDKLTAQLRRPYFRYVALLRAFARAQLAGDLDHAEQLAADAFELGSTGVESDAMTNFGIQLYAVRYYQGQLGELVAACADYAARYPDIVSWRLALALAHVHNGALADARSEFDIAANAGFDQIPIDSVWGITIPMAAEVCAAIGDVARAAELYELLRQYDRCFLVVTTSIACHGAVGRFLGLVARTMGQLDVAVHHFQAALTANKRIGAAVIAARTAADYAATVLLRDAPGDRALALSLTADARTTISGLAIASLEQELDELECAAGA